MSLINYKILFFVLLITFPLAQGQDEISTDYQNKIQKMNTLENRVRDIKIEIKSLIDQKNGTLNAKQRVEIIGAIKEQLKEYNKWGKAYEEVRAEIKYLYPDKGEIIERRYLPHRTQSMEDIEQEAGIDSTLSDVKKTVDKKYRPILEEKRKKRKAEKKSLIKKTKKAPEEEEKPEKLKLVR